MVYNIGKNDKKGVRESFFHRNRVMMNMNIIKKNRKKSLVVLSIALLIVVAVVLLQYKPFEGPYESGKPLLSEPEMVMAAANKEILPPKEAERALNVLLMGIDDRSSGFGGRTDSIIIATIDFSSDSIRFTSVLRDTYVDIPEHGYSKINAAYTYGGPGLLIRTLKYNLNIEIDHYAVIDFNGFQHVIDRLGGIPIDIQDVEIGEMNRCMINTPQYYINEPGIQNLNGIQALAYARIRYVGNSDFQRVERQRSVLSQIALKIRGAGLKEGAGLISAMFPYIKSDASISDLLAYGYRFNKMDKLDTFMLTLPASGDYQSGFLDGQSVILPNLQDTAEKFHQFATPGIEIKGLTVPDNSIQFQRLNNS